MQCFVTCKLWYDIKWQDNFGDRLEGSCKDSTIDLNLHFLFVTEEHQVGVSYLNIMKFVSRATYFHILEEAEDKLFGADDKTTRVEKHTTKP